MKLALCIEGCGSFLKEGGVYEIQEVFTCDGQKLADVPTAKNLHTLSHPCEKCGRDIQTTWFYRRFIPINDADVKDDVKNEEEITA